MKSFLIVKFQRQIISAFSDSKDWTDLIVKVRIVPWLKELNYLYQSVLSFQKLATPIFFFSQSTSYFNFPICLYSSSINSSFYRSWLVNDCPLKLFSRNPRAWVFHIWAWVGWMAYSEQTWETVLTPDNISKTTFTLKAGWCCLLIVFPIIYSFILTGQNISWPVVWIMG